MWLGPPACQIRITESTRRTGRPSARPQPEQAGQRQAAERQAADLEESAAADAVAGAITAADEFQHEDSLTQASSDVRRLYAASMIEHELLRVEDRPQHVFQRLLLVCPALDMSQGPSAQLLGGRRRE